VFLTSALVGSGQLHAPAALPPTERSAGTYWIRGWLDLRAGPNNVEKRAFMLYRGSNFDPPVGQPVASRCTDCAAPAYGCDYVRLL
jgi:hypothetical protein